MIDEGIYLFFESEVAAQPPFVLIDLSKRLMQDIKNKYASCEVNFREDEDQSVELKPLSERKFIEYNRKIRTVLFVCTRSMLDLEFALIESAEMVSRFREAISNRAFLFGIEIWDESFFWTGASIRRWFETRFPLKPKDVKYAKPPSILDLLYEFLESVPHSKDNLFTLKETMVVLSKEDRLFIENILTGKQPMQNSAEAEETSARILRRLMDRKV